LLASRPSGGAPSLRDAAAFNHEFSAAETIPCGTDGSVRRPPSAEHNGRRASHLHKLGIKVKIAGIKRRDGAKRGQLRSRIFDFELILTEKSATCGASPGRLR
jgi:hypothetical protein